MERCNSTLKLLEHIEQTYGHISVLLNSLLFFNSTPEKLSKMAPNPHKSFPVPKLKTWHIVLIIFFGVLGLICMVAVCAGSGKAKRPEPLPKE